MRSSFSGQDAAPWAFRMNIHGMESTSMDRSFTCLMKVLAISDCCRNTPGGRLTRGNSIHLRIPAASDPIPLEQPTDGSRLWPPNCGYLASRCSAAHATDRACQAVEKHPILLGRGAPSGAQRTGSPSAHPRKVEEILGWIMVCVRSTAGRPDRLAGGCAPSLARVG